MPTSRPTRFSFFALAGQPDSPSAFRVTVTAGLQTDLSAAFQEQLEAFKLDDSTHVDYAKHPQYKPDEGELFELGAFSFPEAIPNLGTGPDLPPLSDELIESGSIRALVGVPQGLPQVETPWCFQALDSRQLIKRSTLSILLSGDTFSRSELSGIVVKDSLAAVYRNSILYFPHEPPVRRFANLSSAFTAATDPQVRKFLRQKLFVVEDAQAILDISDKWTRRKISAIEARGILKNMPVDDIVKAGRKFNVEVHTRTIDGQKALAIPAEKHLFKNLLRLLDEDFLVSELTPECYRVNSKLPLSS